MEEALRLFRQYKDSVYRLALSLTGSVQDAEDVTQSVFLKLLETKPALEAGRERAWLFQVAANECRGLWRRLSRRRTEPLEEALTVAAPEADRAVLEAVGRLKPGDRAVLYLFYYEGYTTHEIGGAAPHQPERRHHPPPAGQTEAENDLGTGGNP